MGPRILALGELLWDLLPRGAQPGGAPANYAIHCRGLGAEARLVTRVGDDARGKELLAWLGEHGLALDTVQVDSERPTGTVSVTLSEDGQPTYIIHEGVAWDRIALDGPALEAVREVDAICFGSLAQRSPISHATIRDLVIASPPRALRIFDVNLRPPYDSHEVVEESLALANVVKVNDLELERLAEWLGLGGTVREQVEELARRFALRLVAVTRGAGGSLLFGGGRWSEHPGFSVELADTVGAGDAFTAALTLGWLAGRPLDLINAWANAVGAYVCSRSGGTPPLSPSIVRSIAEGMETPPASPESLLT